MQPLYAIADEYQNLLLAIEDNDFDEVGLIELLKLTAQDFNQKAVDVTAFFLNMESEAKMVKEAENRLKARRIILEKKAKQLRKYLLDVMQLLDIPEIKSDAYHVKTRKNPPSVQVVDDFLIPEEFKTREEVIKIDKNSIKIAIKAGEEVPGAYIEQKYRLDVK